MTGRLVIAAMRRKVPCWHRRHLWHSDRKDALKQLRLAKAKRDRPGFRLKTRLAGSGGDRTA